MLTRSTLTGFATAVAIDAGAIRNSVVANQLFNNGAGIVNLGTDTEAGHNQVP